MRLLFVISLLGALIPGVACGGGRGAVPQGASLSGNWQITLSGTTSSSALLTGFLVQSGNSVSGGLVLFGAATCSGLLPVTGTSDGQNVSLKIDQFGSMISLTGTTANPGAPMGGDFASQAGPCNTGISGTWSAVPVAPIGRDSFGGSFHGAFTSASGASVEVKGTLSQGPNTGNSTATLSGTLAITSTATFCPYLSPGTITGLISGESVVLYLYDESGKQYAQLGTIGSTGVTVNPDGTSLSGGYGFSAISDSCLGDTGHFSLSFP